MYVNFIHISELMIYSGVNYWDKDELEYVRAIRAF